jgi:hypothetical protein
MLTAILTAYGRSSSRNVDESDHIVVVPDPGLPTHHRPLFRNRSFNHAGSVGRGAHAANECEESLLQVV